MAREQQPAASLTLVYWMKSHAFEEEWDMLHHIAADDEKPPLATLCGIDLSLKPGVYSLDNVEADSGLKVCKRCQAIHQKSS